MDESQVGPGRKTLTSSSSDVGPAVVASQLASRNFITNVVAVAAGTLLLLLYISSEDYVRPPDGLSDNLKYQDPIPSPTVIPVSIDDGSSTTKPFLPTLNPTPSTIDDDDDVGEDDDTGVDDDKNGDAEPDSINVYSKYATFEPLPGIPLPDEEAAKMLQERWGGWNFWDDEEDSRPTENFLLKFPNGDVPNDQFPENAWQADAVFVNHYLHDAGKLVERAMEAIYAEYGYSSEGMTPEQLAARSDKIFQWYITDGPNDNIVPNNVKKGRSNQGGFIPKKSHDGLVRRLLHAMMTSDTFTVVLCGHSVAAGSGNGSKQSFIMQFHKVMAPVFARLGVKLVTRNMAQGGLGTIQGSLGLQSIYGDEIDMLLWDSGMTEGGVGHVDLVARQGALGKRVPVFMGLGMDMNLMTRLYDSGMDVGGFLTATAGIPETTSVSQAEEVPYAARYVNCGSAMKDYCKQVPRFCWNCWLGDDKITPPHEQREQSSDNSNFHPGWRELQIRGRNLAMMVLRALQEAVEVWSDNVQGGPPLDEELWHVSEYYDGIRSNIRNTTESFCHEQLKAALPQRVCDVPMRAYTEFTPRNNPDHTSITSIAKPAPDGTRPKSHLEDILNGFVEPVNPCSVLPSDAVDVYSIVSGGRSFQGFQRLMMESSWNLELPPSRTRKLPTKRQLDSGIIPGNGWSLLEEKIGNCDGTFNSRCYLGHEESCLLASYNSARGALVGDEYSGWLVLEIDSIKEGLIILKVDPWLAASKEPIPSNWTSGNRDGRNLKGYNIVDQSEQMVFEYAINGNITSIPWKEFRPALKKVQRTVYLVTLLDDPGFQGENVEVGIRMRDCGRKCRYGISHVYYA